MGDQRASEFTDCLNFATKGNPKLFSIASLTDYTWK